MTRTTPTIRILTIIALFTGTVLVAGCSDPDRVTRTTTTDQTTTSAPMPMPMPAQSTTTTTTEQTRP